ncbi:TolC family protein [Kaistella sp. PBT33-4]|uniref:TolC family protein n=1 Tax=Kaistella sp. PBT33-4 TaxID=3032000 RepID=UPI0031F3359E
MKNKYLHILFLLCFLNFFSQTPVSLETAFEKAIENNLQVKSGQLKKDYHHRIKNSAAVVDPLNITAEIGQLNSAYADNAISVNQKLRLPKFYQSQNQVLMEEWKNAMLTLEVQKLQLKRELALSYNNLNYLDEKQKLLEKADSIYSQYYQRADLRLRAGESNILEKTTAENYRSQAEIQLQNLMKDREVSQHQLNYLINDAQYYTNLKGGFYIMELISDGNYDGNATVLKQYEQQKNIENAKLNAEKTKLLPSVNLGVTSATQYGFGADEKFYDRGKRFQSGLIGLDLPLFNTAQKSIIEGQKINQQIAENNYQIAVKNLKNRYAVTFGAYLKLKSELEYYRSKGLKNAQTIFFTANLLLKEGEINYLEYTMLVNQSLEIENRYIDAQKLFNEKIIELNALRAE